jgi:RNA-binding protein YhbY
MLKKIELTEEELETLQNALDNHKFALKVRCASSDQERKEKAINEIYNAESIEKKAKK